MTMFTTRVAVLVLVVVTCVLAQAPDDPFPAPIPATDGVITVTAVEFAAIPDIDGQAARMMDLIDEPGTQRLFVNDMRGPLYSVSYDGKNVMQYVDVNDPKWGVRVESTGRERGFQNFAFHPQFSRAGTPGFGRFYTYTDTTNQTPRPDFTTSNEKSSHDTVLLEWTARTPGAATYDGGPPRDLFRLRQPFGNHNAGYLGFNPLAEAGSADYGMLYIGVADGGSGGDPLNLAQNPASAFGKVFRINPLGTNGRNKQYGVPADNPFINTPDVLPEIYASGVRNPQRFAWDPRNGNMFLADIGQNIVEEISPVPRGGNLGWNIWEGSFGFISRRAVDLAKRRSDPKMTYPGRRMGPARPAAAAAIRGRRTGRLSRHRDPAACEPADLCRHAQRRDLLRECGQPAERRTGRDPPDSADRQRHEQNAARADPGEEQSAGQDAGDTIRRADQSGRRQSHLSTE